MFWDLVSNYYEVFENLYNGKVNREMCRKVAFFTKLGYPDISFEMINGRMACGIAVIKKQNVLNSQILNRKNKKKLVCYSIFDYNRSSVL